MALTLSSKAIDDGGQNYYTDAYKTMIETHIAWLKNHRTTNTMAIDAGAAYKYAGDLNGLLLNLNIPFKYHYAIMRINDLHAPTEYTADMVTLIVPFSGLLDQLYQVFITTSAQLR